MNIKIQQQHPSCVWLAKTGKERKTWRQGERGKLDRKRKRMMGNVESIGSQRVNLGWLMPLHKAACGVLCANYHNHRQQCKWRNCESFQLSPSTHHTATACPYDPRNSRLATGIIFHCIIWWSCGKFCASCCLIVLVPNTSAFLCFDFFYTNAWAKEFCSKMTPTSCQKKAILTPTTKL